MFQLWGVDGNVEVKRPLDGSIPVAFSNGLIERKLSNVFSRLDWNRSLWMPLLSWQWPISGKGLYNPLPLAVVFSRYRSFSDVITISQAAVLLFSSLTMVEASLSIAHPYSIYALLMARPCHSNNETFINRKTFTCDPALQFYHSPPTLSRRQRTSPSPQFHVP